MCARSEHHIEIRPQRYRLALVLRTLFFPFTYPDVSEALKKRGYIVPPLPPLPRGPRIYISGHIAKKDDCTVSMDDSRKLIASEGSSIESVIKTLRELMVIAKEDFYVDLAEEADYLELTADLVVVSEKNPMESIGKIFKESKFMRRINEILNLDSSIFTFGIAPKGGTPANKNWLDIRLEPRITMPTRGYDIRIVYRDSDVSKVLKFAGEVNLKIEELIKEMEAAS